jgi:signal peptidase I
VKVTSHSMSPTIGGGDWIVVDDLDNSGRDMLQRGDLVLFRFPFGSDGRAVKRVVALGGDTVAIAERSVTVNGRPIPIVPAPGAGSKQPHVQTVPRGHVFLLGDNTRASIDSRSFGSVPHRELVGRVPLVIGNAGSFVLPGSDRRAPPRGGSWLSHCPRSPKGMTFLASLLPMPNWGL